jgi:hypothetical protein
MTFRNIVCFSALVVSGLWAAVDRPAAKVEQEPKYDAATVVDFEAVVIDTREVAKENPLCGFHLQVKTESDSTLGVYLGPSDFVKSFEIVFKKGDRIHIVGSKVKLGGEPVVLAREIRKDSATLYLRGKDGAPYWVVAKT